MKTVSIKSYSDVISRIVLREGRVIGLWLEEHEMLRVLFVFRWADSMFVS